MQSLVQFGSKGGRWEGYWGKEDSLTCPLIKLSSYFKRVSKNSTTLFRVREFSVIMKGIVNQPQNYFEYSVVNTVHSNIYHNYQRHSTWLTCLLLQHSVNIF